MKSSCDPKSVIIIILDWRGGVIPLGNKHIDGLPRDANLRGFGIKPAQTHRGHTSASLA